MNRRKFIRNNSLLIGGLSLLPAATSAFQFSPFRESVASNRPALKDRTFTSQAVENLIKEVSQTMVDTELAWMFTNCYPNTLDTTVDYEVIDGKADTFIITGDIDAMWLRDSTAQVWPYMPLIVKEEHLRLMVKGLINRQVKCVIRDPYANAFYKDLGKESHWKSDQPSPIPGVHERKWEIDSLCYVIRLSMEYFRLTKDKTIFDADWQMAAQMIVQTFRTEQRKNGDSPYFFLRNGANMIDAPAMWGKGRSIKSVGLIASMFRPSDDATLFPFLIPSNLFAVQSLRQLEAFYTNVIPDPQLAQNCTQLADEVEAAVEKYGISEHLDFGEIYGYEVDGFGNKVFMDDANVPSLMSLAYLGILNTNDPLYKNTRKFLLSDANPHYLKGKAAEGQSSPHTGKEKIWPMGIILRAMTSTDKSEIVNCLKMLKATHAGTGFMHEAFHKDDPKDFNRSWFAWANTLFGELIVKLHNERPEILTKPL